MELIRGTWARVSKSVAAAPVNALVLFLVIVPLIMVLLTSVRTRPPQYEGSWTLSNFDKVLGAPWLVKTLVATLQVGVITLIIAMFLGVTLAYIVTRTNTPGAKLLDSLSTGPMLLSPVVAAIAWHLLANDRIGVLNKALATIGIPSMLHINSVSGMGWVMGLYYAPFVYLFVSGALKSMDPSLEESARVCGSSNLRTAFTISLPMVMPAVISSGLLSFVLALGLYGPPAVLGYYRGEFVLTTRIWALMRLVPTDYGIAAVLSVLLLIMTVFGILGERRIIHGRTFTTVTGKGFRTRRVDIGPVRYVTALYSWLYVLVAIVLPFVILIVMALAQNTAQLTPFTGRHFSYLVTKLPFFWTSLKNSIILGTVGATLAMVLTSIISLIIVRFRVAGTSLLSTLTTIPVAIPGLVMGAGVLWTYLWLAKSTGILLYGTIWVLMIACVTRFIPYGVRSTSSTLAQIHPELEESSRVCGRSGIQTLLRITVPLLKPGFIAGWILMFTMLFRELTMVILLYTGKSIVLPVLLIELWAEGTYPEIAALSLVQAGVLFAFILAFRYLFGANVELSGGRA